MTRFTRLLVLVFVAAPLAGSAQAAPRVLDIIPAQGPVVVVAADHAELADAALRRLLKSIGHDRYAGIAATMEAMGLRAGLDLAGSVAIVYYPPENDAGPLRPLVLLPTADPDRFFAGVGARPDSAIRIFTYAGVEYFSRRVGQSHVLLGDARSLVERFDDRPGRTPLHIEAAGASGRQILGHANIVALTNAAGVSSILKSLRQLSGDPDHRHPAASPAALDPTVFGRLSRLARDESRGITIGLTFLEAGARLEIASAFAPGSVLARAAVAPAGDAPSALSLFPSDPILAALSIDAAHAGVRSLADELAMPGRAEGMASELERAVLGAIPTMEALGIAVFEPPSLMFGGLSRAVVSWRAPAAEEPAVAWRSFVESLNERSIAGGRIVSAYAPGGAVLAGHTADAWTITLPNSAAGWLPFTLGPPPTVEGVSVVLPGRGLTSCSRDRALLDRCASDVPFESSLARHEPLVASVAMLPQGRIVEGYADVGPLLKQFAPMLAGRGAIDASNERFEPIAAALTANEGSATVTVVVPAGVLRIALAMWLGPTDEEQSEPARSP